MTEILTVMKKVDQGIVDLVEKYYQPNPKELVEAISELNSANERVNELGLSTELNIKISSKGFNNGD